jgi:NADPH:quinone reductase-like Zn-dependent oxidoreductase
VKAVVYRTHGGPEVLEYADQPDPAAGPGAVVVQVHAVGLNRLDLLQRGGPGLLPGFELPHIAGMDAAGTIVAVGLGVDAGRIGERVVVNPALACGTCAACRRGADNLCGAKLVVGASTAGGYGSLLAVPATHALPIPDGVELSEAAAVPTVYSRAWQSLFVTGGLAIGETVLAHAAASAVTIAAVHLAKRAGARVIVTARTDDELEYARRHGADEFVNTTTTDVAAAVRELTDGEGVDLVFDHLGPALFEASIQSLCPHGRLVFFGTTTGGTVSFNLAAAYHKGIRLLGSESYSNAEFERMLRYCWTTDLPSIIDRVVPITDVAAAHELMANDELRGKLVMTH